MTFLMRHFGLSISIHIPAKGTTNTTLQDGSTEWISIHVPAKGTTLNLLFTSASLPISIHVPAKGTTVRLPDGVSVYYFNPRSREGNDTINVTPAEMPAISIHVPAKGTTQSIYPLKLHTHISIHVPAKGTTAIGFTTEAMKLAFQSTFPRRERLFLSF